uniref:Uncharacterized protein n=1 Tax=Acrobeloides nanus TaxID=290746 RepID=A0A914DI79_9BILA
MLPFLLVCYRIPYTTNLFLTPDGDVGFLYTDFTIQTSAVLVGIVKMLPGGNTVSIVSNVSVSNVPVPAGPVPVQM